MDTPVLSADSLWTGVGGALVALVGGAVYMRRKLSQDAAGRAGDRAEIDIIAKLSESLKNAQTRQTELETRADKAYEERNKLVEEKAELRGKNIYLEAQVDMLRAELDKLRGPPHGTGQ
jgi:hypothetical protein